MREDWEVKKLGDICEISYGNRVVKNRDCGSLYPVYGGGGATFFVDSFNRENTVIISRFGMSPKCVRFVKGKFFLNDSGLSLIANQNIICQSYLDMAMFALNDAIYSLGKGAAQKNLDVIAFNKLNIKYPTSLVKQQQIVEELDCLTSIIDKQKKQLEELDNLEQAIFYDMFGDPIENEKGWKNDILINLCTKITDGTHDTPLKLTEGIKFITGKHIRKGCIDYDHSDYVDIQTHVEIFKRCNPEYGDILYTNIGANLGTAAINKVHYEFSMKNVSLLKINKNLLSSYFLEFILNNDRKKLQIIRDFSKGGAQKFLSLNSISNIKIPLPPLPLQQQFASKIEAIEKQKELIKKSIKETEDLFNSRMDYYFN